jgi:exopolysaccharide biosynthesis polyprenyl glycosylphosphotransferase
MLACADVCTALFAAGALAVAEPAGTAAAIWAAALAPGWILLAKARGLYDLDHVRIRHQTVDEVARLLDWIILSVALTALFLAVAPSGVISAQGAVAMGVTALVVSVPLRALMRWLWRKVVPVERGLVIGTGQLADALARKLALESGHHLALIARVGLETSEGNGARQQARVELEELGKLVDEHRIERVVLALHDLDEETLSSVAAACRLRGIKLSVAPPLRAMLGTAVDLTHLAELPLIEFRTWDTSRSTMLLKRVSDFVVASSALLFLLPVLAVVAGAIKIDSPGRALFRQRRAGRGGRPFNMLKFRTMVPDAEVRVYELIRPDELDEPMFKIRDDPRVTRVGRFLRRWSLDELPQLVNVVRGEMSLVGPRPEELWLVERYGEAERFRLEMPPGMTGPMQVHGRGELTFQERLAVEREYVENYSVRKDLKILAKTASAVVHGRGAF